MTFRRRAAFLVGLGFAAAASFLAARAQDEPPPLEPTPEAPASKPAEGTTRLTLLFTSDIHGHYLPHLSVGKRTRPGKDGEVPKPVKVGGISTVASKVAALKASGANVLLFDSGDVMSGHPVCDLERLGAKGGALYQMLNLAGYDAAAIGNHDFDHGRENTAKLVEIARFPLLCANMKVQGDPPLKLQRWVILERFGLKIGVFGLMTDGFLKVVGKEKVAGIEVTPSIDAAREAVAELRPKCDLVIALTHCGSGEDQRLVKAVQGIDVVLGGHDHRPVEPHVVEGTILAEGALKAMRLGQIDLTLKDKKIVGHEGRLLTLPFAAPEGELKTVMDDVYEACGKQLEEVLAKLATEWKRSSHAESNIGDFFCDALIAKTGGDVSFLNSGGIRTNVSAGDLTVGDVMEVFPIENEVVAFELTGEELEKALAHNATAGHGILQVGGVRYEFQKTGRREAKVVKAEVGGKPLDPKKTYRCIATDFVAIDQADKYLGVVPAKHEKLGFGMAAAAIEYVRQMAAKGPIDTPLDGRIKLVKEKD